MSPIISIPLLVVIFLVSPASASTVTLVLKHNNVTDRDALVSFKSMISSDPRGSLDSWNASIHFCQWLGVTCGGRRHPQRVISLDLRSLYLTGFVSPTITNLTFLKTIDLSDNRFHGSIPQEMGRLWRLQYLNLSVNSLEGGIPATLSHCSKLKVISMKSNTLQGTIPPGLSNCSDVQIISLGNNSLTGQIPPSYTNLTFLSFLSLYMNQLTGIIPPTVGHLRSLAELNLENNQLSGAIPSSVGKLSKLRLLALHTNNLTGTIPPSVWNISLLQTLDFSLNSLTGVLPPNTGQSLPLLEFFGLSDNKLHGPIPTSLSNASRLENLSLASNMFSSTIPSELGSLQNLRMLVLDDNLLGAGERDELTFLTTLVNCTKLKVLNIGLNKLGGTLPCSIANLSSGLLYLGIGDNYVSGNIPSNIGNLVSLVNLDLGPNLLVGSIPSSIGALQNLHVLDLNRNKLSGTIPSTIGNLTQLNDLYLDFNELNGSIPANLGNCRQLSLLNLKANKLTGAIPKEILTIPTLALGIDLSNNSLTGGVPSEVGNLINVVIIDFSINKLNGQIPIALGECVLLLVLDLGGNLFQGKFPSSLGSLRGIEWLDVSKNNLSGRIPDFLEHFRYLQHLNLSFNNFNGEVPIHGVFENTSAFSILGNDKLCGGNPAMQLPPCPYPYAEKNKRSHTLMFISIAAACVLSMLIILVVARRWVRKARRKPQESSWIKEKHAKVSYAKLVRATNGFSGDNLIGTGSFGTIYKGMLDDNGGGFQAVAVKVLNLQVRGASKSFMSECEALRNIRHRNLVRIITVCSSIDYRGNDFKALVFEFMANGSLDDWLHYKEDEEFEPKKLSLVQRLNIAIDAAAALDYMHCQCEIPIVHCDLKPSNILLSGDMTAYVGDFGLAKLLEETTSKSHLASTSSLCLKGTIGYIAPEYGMVNKITIEGDIYSYGILLLEMFTGKRPTDAMFEEGLNLRKYVDLAFPDQIFDIADGRLFSGEEEEEANDNAHVLNGRRAMDCLASVFKMGIECSNELPAERMKMGVVVSELQKIKDVFTRGERGDRAH